MLKPKITKPKFNFKKEVSWSSFSSFRDYDKEEWYQHYYMGKPTPQNPEMAFGSKAGKSFESNRPMARVKKYAHMEYMINAISLNKVPIMGKLDSYRKDGLTGIILEQNGKQTAFKETKKRGMREYKTGKLGKSQWCQKRADKHDQITFYCLLVYLDEGIRPEDIEISLDWYPTKRDKRHKVCFIDDIDSNIVTFTTTRTLAQILKFDKEIAMVYKQMQEYVDNHR